jgi:outer membrane translocation and assembly module TamA
MPATKWDEQQRMSRGYFQGRYRGRNMVYLEGEYRFKITPKSVLSGVVFANAESFSEPQSNRFERVLPAVGAGLRIKLNRYTRTNLCIDYAIGVNGSSGIYLNLGETF